jgi:hypothetical protein
MFKGILIFMRLMTLLLMALVIVSGSMPIAVEAQVNRQVAPSDLKVNAGDTPNPYYSVQTITLSDGTQLKQITINGPAKPPPGYELERASVAPAMLNRPGIAASLPVPAYDWVFGCSAVSAAMIGAYFDRNGLPNIYTGPTDGGVIPMDNSVWPTWTDSVGQTYPGNPLVASRNGSDGRTARGSIDDYWVAYDSADPDPYITGGWAQHAWSDAFGDFMKTSQSAYGHSDGATGFWGNDSAAPLTCAEMESFGLAETDGTYGRKLFYEARGYSVAECYNQDTDNNTAGGFSFADYKAQIDAGYPVLLQLRGHSIVGVGYADPATVYIHDTWDHQTHQMTWGSSYGGLPLEAVSIANPAIPAPAPTVAGLAPASATAGGPAFTLTVNGASFVSNSVVRWNGANRPTTYVNSAQLTAAITAADIAAAGAANVTVFNPAPGGGTSNAVAFAVNNPAPAIAGLSPSWATPGGPAFTLTVNGAGFVSASVVRWNGASRTTTYVNGSQLTAAITPADIAVAGAASITVFNPTPGGGASSTASFTIGNPVPAITGLSPFWATPGGPAFTLTVNGIDFVNGAVVRWNGVNRTTTYVNNMQLTASIIAADIAATGTATITVANPTPGGGASGAASFLVGALKKAYLPLVVKNFPPLPGIPTLNPISNDDRDGNYTVSWTSAEGAASYSLQEDDNSGFASPTVVYSDAATAWPASEQPAGTYFYRVQAVNAWGRSGWSNTVSTVVQPAANNGINGHVAYQGAAAASIGLLLRFFNGSSWSMAATTYTDATGLYRFLGLASLSPGQKYYVRFGPNTSNPAYLWAWWGPSITSYTSGSTVPGGDFDIADVSLLSPADGSAAHLPVTLSWQQRGIATDTYRVQLWDPSTGEGWLTNDLGNVGNFNITSLPPGAVFGRMYRWDILVFNGPDSYGESLSDRRITFVSSLAQSPETLSEWVTQYTSRE